jgi:integrase
VSVRAIYTRDKGPDGKWLPYRNITKKGVRNGHETGPFRIHIEINGKQEWPILRNENGEPATDIETAKKLATKYDATVEAVESGVAVADDNRNRISLRTAVDHFIQEKTDGGCTLTTLRNYKTILEEFLKLLPGQIRFVHQTFETVTSKGIPKRTSSVLTNYLRTLKEDGASARTIFNKIQVVFFMLKEAGVAKPSKLVKVPDYEEEEAVPYSKQDLQKLFSAMEPDDNFLFTFFLDSACRKGEIAHATWNDVYDGKYHVRNKTYTTSGKNAQTKHYTVKTHDDRRVPLTRELLQMVEDRRTKSDSKWIFPNAIGNPENDNGFIRRLRRIAKKAGLICGQCHSELKRTDRFGKNPRYVDVCCADDCHVCEQHYLHRFRKTTATHWHNTGVPIRTIQKWLGHKSLETTMIYLGVKDDVELQKQINAPKF